MNIWGNAHKQHPSHQSLRAAKSQNTHPVCSGFSIGGWRRSRTVIFHFTHRRSTPESLAMSRGLAMYRNMQEIRRRDGICASPKAPLPPPSSLRYNIFKETLIQSQSQISYGPLSIALSSSSLNRSPFASDDPSLHNPPRMKSSNTLIGIS